MKLLIFTFLAIFSIAAARDYDRPCRTAELSPLVKTGFIVSQYTGLWYEIGSYETALWPLDCSQARYNAQLDGSVQVINSGRASNGTLITFEGRATLSEPNTVPLPAKLDVTFFPGQASTIYWVLSTNYFEYALVWSCTNLAANRSREQAWVLSRTPELSVANAIRINTLIAEKNLNLETMVATQQDRTFCLRP